MDVVTSTLLLAIAWKASVAAAIVIAVSFAAVRVGPWGAAILVGFPISIGPGMVLLSLSHDRAFIAQTTLYSLATAVPVLAFLLVYVWLARKSRFWLCLLGAYLVWLTMALGLSTLTLTLPWTALSLLVGFAITAWCMPRSSLGPTGRGARSDWRFVLVRGVAAGLVVGTVVGCANLLGPRLSGVLVSFPVVLASAAWMLTMMGGERLAVATLSHADRGMGSFVAFCLAVHLLSGPLPAMTATIAALGISALISLLLFFFSARVHRSAA